MAEKKKKGVFEDDVIPEGVKKEDYADAAFKKRITIIMSSILAVFFVGVIAVLVGAWVSTEQHNKEFETREQIFNSEKEAVLDAYRRDYQIFGAGAEDFDLWTAQKEAKKHAAKGAREAQKKREALEREAKDAYKTAEEKAYKDFASIATGLEREIAKLHNEIQSISHEYEEIIKKSKVGREQFDKHKEKYTKLKTELEPKINALKADLAKIQKEVDGKLLQKYNQNKMDGC